MEIKDTKEFAINSTEFINPTQEQFILRTKKAARLFILIISHVFAGLLIFGDTQTYIHAISNFSFATLFFGFFTFVTIPFAWYNYFDNKPKLTISNQGITVNRKDIYNWDMIATTKLKSSKEKCYLILSSLGASFFPKEIQVDITYLDKKAPEIAQIIEVMKKRSTATNKSITENAG